MGGVSPPVFVGAGAGKADMPENQDPLGTAAVPRGSLAPRRRFERPTLRLGVRRTGFQPFYALPANPRQARLYQGFAGFRLLDSLL